MTANAKFDWEYNGLYDVFYKAGVPVSKMRVASPFMSESKSSLGLYRVIDGHTWAKLCARVQGANFVATYGKQLGYRSFKLPANHTWKSFVKFLLDTLPKALHPINIVLGKDGARTKGRDHSGVARCRDRLYN